MCTLNASNCLLLELPFTHSIQKGTLNEISRLTDELGFKVIIAHIERCFADKQYKNLLSLVKNNTVSAQINADSFLDPVLKKPIEKLLKQNLVSFVASDAHSLEHRPVKIKEFLNFVLSNYPTAYRKIILNTDNFYKELKENNCVC